MERPAAPAAPEASLTHNEKVTRLKAVFEVTVTEASNVLDACGGSLEQAIAVLSSSAGDQAPSTGGGVITQETGGQDQPQQAPAVDLATGSVNDPIDLTREDDALQRALALSIQDMQQQQPQGGGAQGGGASGISLEDQELSRALEASIAENQASLARLGLPPLSVFVDPLNPHERCRAGHTPVGLKNIGNTCWFSAVIQSLFHIPVFRETILSYSPPALSNGVIEYPQCVRFVLELQRLFSLLLGSERKYINPQAAVQALREAFPQSTPSHGLQQDVSEVTHKLLEWIEDAFKMAVASEGVEGDARGNPVVQLFNGHCRSEGILGDTPFVNESGFGAFPVQVRGHTHLYDSIEAATCNPEMQQETWFTHLPPILVLELSRFHFNQRSGQAEKIHDFLPFNRVLFMDRYLEAKKAESRRRRLEVARLRASLKQLQTRLSSYMHYQRRPVSITEVLGLTLQFIHSEEKDPAPNERDPAPCSERMNDSGNSITGKSLSDSTSSQGQSSNSPAPCDFAGEDVSDRSDEGSRGKRPRTCLHPTPQFVSRRETETLDACLTRWTQEVEQDIAELRGCVAAAQRSLAAVYSDALMCSTRYQLHAVLVHQGQASGGHYWAYVRRRAARDEGRQRNSGDHTHTMEGAGSQHGSDARSHDPAASGDVILESLSESEELNVAVSEPGETARTDLPTDSHTGQLSTADSRLHYTVSEPSDNIPCSQTGQAGSQTGQAGSQTGQAGSQTGQASSQTGQAGSARKGDGERWLKFNDVSVVEVGWEEVVRESFGGQQNTSAYCLLYISRAAEEQWAGHGELVSQSPLSPELQRYVAEDNARLRAEIADYDAQRAKIEAAKHIHWEDREAAGKAGASVSDGAAHAADARPVGPKHDHSPEHMQVDSTVHVDPLALPPVDPLLLTELRAKLEHKHHQLATEEGQDLVEPRLCHVGSYAIHSDAPEPLVRAVVLHEVAMEATGSRREEIQLLARREYVATLSHPQVQEGLDLLRTCYQLFCAVCYHCLEAVRAARLQRWEDVMVHAVHAFSLNGDVVRQSGREFALAPRWISWLRRKALRGLSSKAFQQFEDGKVAEALQLANSHLIPSLRAFSQCPCEGDEEVLEAVREEWCQCLMHPLLNEAQQDQLADMLTRMFEDCSKASALPTPSTPEEFNTRTLALEFSNAMRLTAEETGE